MVRFLQAVDDIDNILLGALLAAGLHDAEQHAAASWQAVEQICNAQLGRTIVIELLGNRRKHDGAVVVDDVGIFDLVVETGCRSVEVGVSGHFGDSFHEDSG